MSASRQSPAFASTTNISVISRNRILLFWALAAALALLGGLWWMVNLPHAIYDLRPNSAIDLISRHQQVRALFAGTPVYAANNAVYPPAAYVTLWPLIGWASVGTARWLWLLLCVASVFGLGWWTARLSLPNSAAERWFLALVPFSMHATGGVLRYGQVTLLIMLALLLLLLLLLPRPATWARDIGLALLMTVALIKPTIAAPFFWLLLFLPKSLRPALLVLALYLGLTLVAAWLQATNPILLMELWLHNALAGADYGATGVNRVNQQGLLQLLDLPDLGAPVALLMLGSVGGWVAWRRRANLWLLVGLVSIVARLWTYHASYDNLLILLPLIALYRVHKQARIQHFAAAAVVLFGLGLLTTVAPGHTFLPNLLKELYGFLQLATWTAMAALFALLSLPRYAAVLRQPAAGSEAAATVHAGRLLENRYG